MLHLMVHSLYSNREIFLRELISNASDAIDKLKFEAIKKPELLSQDPHPSIRIGVDETAQTITISDDGIGMTREEVISHLGTIAKKAELKGVLLLIFPETKRRMHSLSVSSALVLFFFIVADKATVVTRKAGDPADSATLWESNG